MNNNFERILDIVNSLDKQELDYICNDKFIDSPYLIYRKIKDDSFIEVYYYSKELKDEHPISGNNILIVSSPNSRGMGNADYLLKQALKECPGNFFVYETDKTNKASIHLAQKMVFNYTKILMMYYTMCIESN